MRHTLARLLFRWTLRLAPVLIIGAVVLWAAGQRDLPFVPRTDNTLRRWMQNDPDYLNPILRTSADTSYVQDYIHHYLLEWDFQHNRLAPRLITGYDVSSDGLDYTLHLRHDVRWQDEHRFDAGDVLFSFQQSMDPNVPGYARTSYIDCRITATIPADNGDGQVDADEYLNVEWASLPELDGGAVLDGTPEAGAATLAEAGGIALRAARRGSWLYLSAGRMPRHDLVLLVAQATGEALAYGPSTYIARWDALLFADSGNHYPFPDGWHAMGGVELSSASFAVSADHLEGAVDLAQLYPQGSPGRLRLIACLVDDVQLTRLDDFTVRWHYPRRVFSNLQNCADLRLIAEHYFGGSKVPLREHPRRDIPLGLGPYKFVSWERNTRIVLQRWPGYWGERKPTIERIDFRIFNDAVVAFQAFRKGDIDAMIMTNPWKFKRVVQTPEFQQHFYPRTFYNPGYLYIAWNNRRSFFSDTRCRQAMSHLINPAAGGRYIYEDLARPITGHLFFKEPGYDPGLPQYQYNVEAARALLDEAGWIDRDGDGIRDKDLDGDGKISHEPLDGDPNRRETFSFDFLTSAGPDAQNNWVALSMVQNCAKVGIRCRMRMVEFALWLDWVKKRDYDASYGQWLLGFEADPYEWFHTSQTRDGFNREQYSNPETDRMLEAARAELDPATRAQLWRVVHRKLWADQPYTWLLSPQRLWVFNRRVSNVTAYDLDFDVLEWKLAGHQAGK